MSESLEANPSHQTQDIEQTQPIPVVPEQQQSDSVQINPEALDTQTSAKPLQPLPRGVLPPPEDRPFYKRPAVIVPLAGVATVAAVAASFLLGKSSGTENNNPSNLGAQPSIEQTLPVLPTSDVSISSGATSVVIETTPSSSEPTKIETVPTLENTGEPQPLDAEKLDTAEKLGSAYLANLEAWINYGTDPATAEDIYMNYDTSIPTGLNDYAKIGATKNGELFADTLMPFDWETRPHLTELVENLSNYNSNTLAAYALTVTPANTPEAVGRKVSENPDNKEAYEVSIEGAQFEEISNNDGIVALKATYTITSNADLNRAAKFFEGAPVTEDDEVASLLTFHLDEKSNTYRIIGSVAQ